MATMTEKAKPEKEGSNLLGLPNFTELESGRLKCVETGHELLAKDKESYSYSKRCRLGLIDFALSHNKPPLNMFKQDPLCRSKLKCKLTGVTINKSEEHIWKHMNGKRFLNKLEQKEMEKSSSNGAIEEDDKQNCEKTSEPRSGDNRKEKNKKKKDKEIQEIISEARMSIDEDTDSEELDFWVPPVGARWDFDDGGDRWGSDLESGSSAQEDGDSDAIDDAVDEDCIESEELAMRTKRMAVEIGPSSFASKKKKSKQST